MDICICIYTHVCEKRLLVPLSSRLITNDRLDSLVHFPDNGSKIWNSERRPKPLGSGMSTQECVEDGIKEDHLSSPPPNRCDYTDELRKINITTYNDC